MWQLIPGTPTPSSGQAKTDCNRLRRRQVRAHDNITREQMAVMLYRYAEYKSTTQQWRVCQ